MGASTSITRNQENVSFETPTATFTLESAKTDGLLYLPDDNDGLASVRLREQAEYTLECHTLLESLEGIYLGQLKLPYRRVGSGFTCTFNPGNYVGCSRLRIMAHDAALLDVRIEIRSLKLGYRDDYRSLLDDLVERVTALCFRFLSPTSLTTEARRAQATPYLTYLLAQYVMDPTRFPAAIARINHHPDRRLVREQCAVGFEQLRSINSKTLIGLVTRPESLIRCSVAAAPSLRGRLKGYLPETMLDERTRIDFDTPPNRFVKHALDALCQVVSRLAALFANAGRERPSMADHCAELTSNCRLWQRRLHEFRRLPFLETVKPLEQVPSASPVLLRREGYRQVRDLYTRLMMSAAVRWDSLEELVSAPNKDLATLYEYWCFFVLADAVARRTAVEPDWSRSLQLEADVFQITLHNRGKLHLQIGSVTLHYNRSYSHSSHPRRGSYSLRLRPDYVLDTGRRLWIFDAKYRLENHQIVEAFEKSPPNSDPSKRKFVKTDIYKMHTYRDAIKRAAGAFILYPGQDFRAYAVDGHRHGAPEELGRDFAGVGAVAAKPGFTHQIDRLLERLL